MDDPKELLLDPAKCGEDILAIANRAFALAPIMCNGCASYHMRVPAVRAAGMGVSVEIDRHLVVAAVRSVFNNSAVRQNRNPTIVILGSADTGLLSTCAHAVAVLDHDLALHTKFIVADLCSTPLALCKEFGALHSLDVTTYQMDFVVESLQEPADVIFLHSVLRFIRPELRASFLQKLAMQLRPGGRLIISNHVYSERERNGGELTNRRKLALQKVFDLMRSGQLKTALPFEKLCADLEESFLVSQNRDSAIQNLDDGLTLLRHAKLQAELTEINQLNLKDAFGEVKRDRFLAIASQIDG